MIRQKAQNTQEGNQSKDASVLLKKGNKIIMGSRGMEDLVRERRGEGKGGRIRCGKRWERCIEVQETEQHCVAMEDGELGRATRKSQMLVKQEAPRTQQE